MYRGFFYYSMKSYRTSLYRSVWITEIAVVFDENGER